MAVLYRCWGVDGKREAPTLLALALLREYDLAAPPTRDVDPSGKPWFPSRPDLHFNLSHSGGLALCGVGDTPIGVDIELVRPRSPGLPARVMSPEEFLWFQGRGSRWEDFYTLWTLKESLCKCTGLGLDRPARLLKVPLLSPGQTGALDGYCFRAYGGGDWRCAACVASGAQIDPEIRG